MAGLYCLIIARVIFTGTADDSFGCFQALFGQYRALFRESTLASFLGLCAAVVFNAMERPGPALAPL